MSENQSHTGPPAVLAGPILRRAEPRRLVFWLAARAPYSLRLVLEWAGDRREMALSPGQPGLRAVSAGRQLCFLLLDLVFDDPLPQDTWIDYDLRLEGAETRGRGLGWRDYAPDLAYPGRPGPGLRIESRVRALFQGSCRKPHHPSADGLVIADRLLARRFRETNEGGRADDAPPDWPAMIVMTGDQIYGDDVAGPMLRAAQRLGEALGLPQEEMSDLGLAGVRDSADLCRHADGFYRRENLLPRLTGNRALIDVLFGGAAKPIFTADNAHNHLITLAEYLAMYLLVWSPAPWSTIADEPPEWLSKQSRAVYEAERRLVEDFVAGLGSVRRLMAHVPVATIFDDHDITDDWNLHRGWEETVYGHPFSRRIVGNGLIAYLICQGWGNRPEAFPDDLLDALSPAIAAPGGAKHDELIDAILDFENWDYDWPTDPPLIVLDTRTRRWRSESSPGRPSGLLDWEALTDLQRKLRGLEEVLLVSASPVFGVKLIEVIQRIFTWIGKPLLVDAENWMAHPGTAHGILNVFRHSKTPKRFVVLSGDVHYSFVYDVELRGRGEGPRIWQICSSGLRNEFPRRLLAALDWINRWLYSPRSPMNWFTSRRRMRIVPRKPEGAEPGRRLLNASGIGVVEIDGQGRPWRIRHFVADDRAISFERVEHESRWD